MLNQYAHTALIIQDNIFPENPVAFEFKKNRADIVISVSCKQIISESKMLDCKIGSSPLMPWHFHWMTLSADFLFIVKCCMNI